MRVEVIPSSTTTASSGSVPAICIIRYSARMGEALDNSCALPVRALRWAAQLLAWTASVRRLAASRLAGVSRPSSTGSRARRVSFTSASRAISAG